ncbi:MAG: ArdC-like ssDNA-binding domain-containing protein [Anaerorhabdus sp.]
MNFKDKIKEQILGEIIESLDNKRIPWKKTWTTNYKHYNYTTGNNYRGRNQLLLELYSIARGYNDPRWMTFEQAKKKGLRVKKGASGLRLVKYSLYDTMLKKPVSKEEFQIMTREEKEHIKATMNFFTVFNASQIEEIEELDLEVMNITDHYTKAAIENYLKTEEIEVVLSDAAAYYPELDRITMPPAGDFIDEANYNSTLLHEIGHSAMVEKRVQKINNYAEEELVAEFTSVLLGIEFGLVNSEMIENHTAYCQSWAQRLQENKELFWIALGYASKASDYIVGRMDLNNIQEITTEEKIEKRLEEIRTMQIDPSKLSQEEFQELKQELDLLKAGKLKDDGKSIQKSEADKVDLKVVKKAIQIVDYARNTGVKLVKKGKLFEVEGHDSCKIYPEDNHFFRYSQRRGGTIIDFIMMFEEVDVKTAIQRAKDYYVANRLSEVKIENKKLPEQIENPRLEKPAEAESNKDVIDYLVNDRCIDKKIVQEYIDEKLLYQDINNNVVFIGRDAGGDALFYSKRGIKRDYKAMSAGSKMSCGIVADSHRDSKVLMVFESAIDAMSYQSLKDPEREYNYLACQSAINVELAIYYYMNERKKEVDEIVLALDNDRSGEQITKMVIEKMQEEYPCVAFFYDTPIEKDWNEDLKKTKINIERGEEINVS